MAGPFSPAFLDPRGRSASDTSRIATVPRTRVQINKPTLSPSPDVSPIHRRGRGTLNLFFTTKPERRRTVADASSLLSARSDENLSSILEGADPQKTGRKRSNSRPTVPPPSLLAHPLTNKTSPLSRVNVSPPTSPTLPAIFASLPSRARERIRNSYDSTRRSLDRGDIFVPGNVSPDIPDPDSPTPTSHSFHDSVDSSYSTTYPKRRSMAAYARPPITSSHLSRRISALPIGGEDDPLDSIGESYRASTADLSDFLRATGPEDSHRPGPVPKSPFKEVDVDSSSASRSRTRSSLFRIGGRRREKSRPTAGSAFNTEVPPVPAIPLPRLVGRDDSGESRNSFSPILPLFNIGEDNSSLSGTGTGLQSSLNRQLPPNTREHRLPDGTTILMITTPQMNSQPPSQPQSQPRDFPHTRSMGSMSTRSKGDGFKSTSSLLVTDQAENAMLQPQLPPLSSSAPPVATKLTSHSPNMSISSDGTLSTAERHRTVSGGNMALLSRGGTLEPLAPQTPTTAHTVGADAKNSYLQVHTPRTRQRGYSSPVSMSPPSAESTPTVTTPTPAFSPSASIAPTPELTPHKSPVQLPESMPAASVDPPSLCSTSAGSPIIVDGLQFPAPPGNPPRPKRRPNTMGAPPTANLSISPARSSKSLRAARSPRKSNPETDSFKASTKKNEQGPRPRPLNLDSVPTYREWNSKAPDVQTYPGELTGLELDLNSPSTRAGKKRDSLMMQHQELFLNLNPFQTPPSPADPFLGPSSKRSSVLPPLVGGPPAMPLPPSPHPWPDLAASTSSPISPRSTSLPVNDQRRVSLGSQRSRLDSLLIRSSTFITPIPASPVTPDAVHALGSVLAAQRQQFDGMSKYLIDMVKAFEEEKRSYEQRIQELTATVAEKDAKAKEDERKIKGLEWLVGNLNLRVGGDKGGVGATSSDTDSPVTNLSRRRSSFSGLGTNEGMPATPLPIGSVFDTAERAKRTASMDDVLRNLVALSLSRNSSRIYEWAANTADEQD